MEGETAYLLQELGRIVNQDEDMVSRLPEETIKIIDYVDDLYTNSRLHECPADKLLEYNEILNQVVHVL